MAKKKSADTNSGLHTQLREAVQSHTALANKIALRQEKQTHLLRASRRKIATIHTLLTANR